MKLQLPPPVLWLLDVIEAHDKEAFLVGGCVRDMYLGRTLHDYDLTTNATPEEMKHIFASTSCKVIPTGIQHGTLTIIKDDLPMEVTTYRSDGAYQDHRKPDQVSYTTSIEEDLARRDLTINAMAWHPVHGLIDPYGGRRDVQEKIIRCVGDPQKRFDEDALRILRALRLSFTLHFTIDEACLKAIKDQAHLLSFISKERIREEFSKMLMSDASDILMILKEVGVLPYIIQEFSMLYPITQETKWHIYDVFTHTSIALNHTLGYSLCEKLAIVLHDFGKADTKWIDESGTSHFHGHPKVSCAYARDILKRMTYPNKIINEVCTLIEFHDYYVQPKKRILRRFLGHIDMKYELAYSILRVQYADDMAKNMDYVQEKIDILNASVQLLKEMERQKDSLQVKDMKVNGRDMIALGYKGKEIKEVLQYLYQIVLDDPKKNEHSQLIELAKEFRVSK